MAFKVFFLVVLATVALSECRWVSNSREQEQWGNSGEDKRIMGENDLVVPENEDVSNKALFHFSNDTPRRSDQSFTDYMLSVNRARLEEQRRIMQERKFGPKGYRHGDDSTYDRADQHTVWRAQPEGEDNNWLIIRSSSGVSGMSHNQDLQLTLQKQEDHENDSQTHDE